MCTLVGVSKDGKMLICSSTAMERSVLGTESEFLLINLTEHRRERLERDIESLEKGEMDLLRPISKDVKDHHVRMMLAKNNLRRNVPQVEFKLLEFVRWAAKNLREVIAETERLSQSA